MELRRYAQIMWKRGWIVALLVLATGLFSVLSSRGGPAPSFQARFRVTVGLAAEEQKPTTYTYDRYYTWLTSEYIADSFGEIVKSQVFADDVSKRLAAAGQPLAIPAGAIQGSTLTEQQHRVLTVTINWANAEQLAAIAEAAVKTLQEENSKYFAQLGTSGASVYVIDQPTLAPVAAGLRQKLDLPIRLLLALLAGLALTFLFDYLDLTVRDRQDLEALGIPVLAQVPPSGRRWPGRRR